MYLFCAFQWKEINLNLNWFLDITLSRSMYYIFSSFYTQLYIQLLLLPRYFLFLALALKKKIWELAQRYAWGSSVRGQPHCGGFRKSAPIFLCIKKENRIKYQRTPTTAPWGRGGGGQQLFLNTLILCPWGIRNGPSQCIKGL